MAKGVPVKEALKGSIKCQLTHLRNMSDGLIVNGQGNNWGGISSAIESYKRECIVNFTDHSKFLLGIDYRPDDDALVAVLSRENFLLNT